MNNLRKILICALIAALTLSIAAPATAEVPSLGGKMIKYAKAALTCLASGDYDKVVTGLPFSGLSPSADEWRSFAQDSFTDLAGSNPQTQYAVAYWTGRSWRVAVPVTAPDNGSVEALVLTSEDGETFSGYACLDWSDVETGYQSSDYVLWKDEYTAANSATVENDVH